MVDIDKSVVCRLKKGSDYFEILVDPDKALVFKKGKETVLYRKKSTVLEGLYL